MCIPIKYLTISIRVCQFLRTAETFSGNCGPLSSSPSKVGTTKPGRHMVMALPSTSENWKSLTRRPKNACSSMRL